MIGARWQPRLQTLEIYYSPSACQIIEELKDRDDLLLILLMRISRHEYEEKKNGLYHIQAQEAEAKVENYRLVENIVSLLRLKDINQHNLTTKQVEKIKILFKTERDLYRKIVEFEDCYQLSEDIAQDIQCYPWQVSQWLKERFFITEEGFRELSAQKESYTICVLKNRYVDHKYIFAGTKVEPLVLEHIFNIIYNPQDLSYAQIKGYAGLHKIKDRAHLPGRRYYLRLIAEQKIILVILADNKDRMVYGNGDAVDFEIKSYLEGFRKLEVFSRRKSIFLTTQTIALITQDKKYKRLDSDKHREDEKKQTRRIIEKIRVRNNKPLKGKPAVVVLSETQQLDNSAKAIDNTSLSQVSAQEMFTVKPVLAIPALGKKEKKCSKKHKNSRAAIIQKNNRKLVGLPILILVIALVAIGGWVFKYIRVRQYKPIIVTSLINVVIDKQIVTHDIFKKLFLSSQPWQEDDFIRLYNQDKIKTEAIILDALEKSYFMVLRMSKEWDNTKETNKIHRGSFLEMLYLRKNFIRLGIDILKICPLIENLERRKEVVTVLENHIEKMNSLFYGWQFVSAISNNEDSQENSEFGFDALHWKRVVNDITNLIEQFNKSLITVRRSNELADNNKASFWGSFYYGVKFYFQEGKVLIFQAYLIWQAFIKEYGVILGTTKTVFLNQPIATPFSQDEAFKHLPLNYQLAIEEHEKAHRGNKQEEEAYKVNIYKLRQILEPVKDNFGDKINDKYNKSESQYLSRREIDEIIDRSIKREHFFKDEKTAPSKLEIEIRTYRKDNYPNKIINLINEAQGLGYVKDLDDKTRDIIFHLLKKVRVYIGYLKQREIIHTNNLDFLGLDNFKLGCISTKFFIERYPLLKDRDFCFGAYIFKDMIYFQESLLEAITKQEVYLERLLTQVILEAIGGYSYRTSFVLAWGYWDVKQPIDFLTAILINNSVVIEDSQYGQKEIEELPIVALSNLDKSTLFHIKTLIAIVKISYKYDFKLFEFAEFILKHNHLDSNPIDKNIFFFSLILINFLKEIGLYYDAISQNYWRVLRDNLFKLTGLNKEADNLPNYEEILNKLNDWQSEEFKQWINIIGRQSCPILLSITCPNRFPEENLILYYYILPRIIEQNKEHKKITILSMGSSRGDELSDLIETVSDFIKDKSSDYLKRGIDFDSWVVEIEMQDVITELLEQAYIRLQKNLPRQFSLIKNIAPLGKAKILKMLNNTERDIVLFNNVRQYLNCLAKENVERAINGKFIFIEEIGNIGLKDIVINKGYENVCWLPTRDSCLWQKINGIDISIKELAQLKIAMLVDGRILRPSKDKLKVIIDQVTKELGWFLPEIKYLMAYLCFLTPEGMAISDLVLLINSYWQLKELFKQDNFEPMDFFDFVKHWAKRPELLEKAIAIVKENHPEAKNAKSFFDLLDEELLELVKQEQATGLAFYPEDIIKSHFDLVLSQLWKDRAKKGLFSYDISTIVYKDLADSWVVRFSSGRLDYSKGLASKRIFQDVYSPFCPKNNFNIFYLQEGPGRRLMNFNLPDGLKVVLDINKNPIIGSHFLIIPDPQKEYPQYFNQQALEAMLFIRSLSKSARLKTGFNSLAIGSINHLHSQGYYLDKQMPIEKAKKIRVGNFQDIDIFSLNDYPARTLAFKIIDNKNFRKIFMKYISLLQESNLQHSLSFIADYAYVWPQKTQVLHEFMINSIGTYEMDGLAYVTSQEQYQIVTLQQLQDEIRANNIQEDLFQALLKLLLL